MESKFTEIGNMTLGGINNKKVVKDEEGNLFMLKFPGEHLIGEIPGHISGYISCEIAAELGYDVQEVELFHWKGKECVKIKLFDEEIITFAGLSSNSLSGNDMLYDMAFLMRVGQTYNMFDGYEKYLWDVFVLDTILANFDRHKNNWGFFKRNGVYVPTPLYDMGSSLYVRLVAENLLVEEEKLIGHLTEHTSKSAIYYGNRKVTYRTFVTRNKDNEMLRDSVGTLAKNLYKTDLKPIFNEVVEYNEAYLPFTTFARRTIYITMKKLRNWVGG